MGCEMGYFIAATCLSRPSLQRRKSCHTEPQRVKSSSTRATAHRVASCGRRWRKEFVMKVVWGETFHPVYSADPAAQPGRLEAIVDELDGWLSG